MRPALLAAVLIGVLAAPAAAGACTRSPDGPERVALTSRLATTFTGPERTGVVLCDRRTGVRTVLARGRWRWQRPVRGRLFTQAVAGPRAVRWLELQSTSAGAQALIGTYDLRSGRTTRTVVGRTTAPLLPENLGVAVLGDGRVAYTVWDDPDRPSSTRRLVVRERGASRVLARGGFGRLAVEDGVTIRASGSFASHTRYVDAGPLASRDGCPVRARFAETARFGDLRITKAASVDEPHAWRVCREGSGQDPVFALTTPGDFIGTNLVLLGAAREGVVAAVQEYDRYEGCTWTTVAAYSAATGRVVRSDGFAGCDLDAHADVVARVRDGS